MRTVRCVWVEHSDGLTHDKTVQCSSYPKACKKKKKVPLYIYMLRKQPDALEQA